jgi:hypothetical protein
MQTILEQELQRFKNWLNWGQWMFEKIGTKSGTDTHTAVIIELLPQQQKMDIGQNKE